MQPTFAFTSSTSASTSPPSSIRCQWIAVFCAFIFLNAKSLHAASVPSTEVEIDLGFPLASQLSVGSNIPVKSGPVFSLHSSRKWLFRGTQYWIAEGSWLYSSLQYRAGDDLKSGSQFQLGMGGGYGIALSPAVFVKGVLLIVPVAGLTAGSVGSIVVNDRNIKFATLTTFSGGIGFQPRASISKNFTLFKWKIPFVASASLLFIQHQYSSRSDRSVVSDDSLAVAPTPSQDKASLSITAFQMGMGVGF